MKQRNAELGLRGVKAACAGLAFALMAATPCEADIYWFWNGKGYDHLLATPENWSGGTVPAVGPDTTIALQSCEGQVLTNNLPRGPYRRIAVAQGNLNFTLVGDEIDIRTCIDNSTAETEAPSVQTFALPIYVSGYGLGSAVAVRSYAGTTMVFDGLVTVAPTNLLSSPFLLLDGVGTTVFRGGISAPFGCMAGGNYDIDKTKFMNGTVCLFSDIDIPNFYAGYNAHLVVSNGTLTTGNTPIYTYVHTCTIDLLKGGRFVPGQAIALMGQGGALNSPVVNVYDGGYLDCGDKVRWADDGFCTLNVYDGGRVDWSIYANYSAAGSTEMNLRGGVVDVKPHVNADYRMVIGMARTKNAGLPKPDRINLAGGELRTAGFKNGCPNAASQTYYFYIDFDGGTLAALFDTDSFYVNGTSFAQSEQIVTRMRTGGLVFDTHGHDVVWGPLPIQGNEGGAADGGLVKRGVGKFTLDAACSYTGVNRVEQGSLVIAAANSASCLAVESGASAKIADISYFSNAVSLASGATLSFGGSSLSLSKLDSDSGSVCLALAAEDAGQRVAVSALALGAGGLGFKLVDSNGADWTANGEYTLLTQSGLASSVVSSVQVVNPVAGKSYSFAVDGDALKVTIADGESDVWVVTESQTSSDELVVDGTKFIRIALGQTLTLTGGVRGDDGARIVVAGPGTLSIACANSVPVLAVDGATVSVASAEALGSSLSLGVDATLFADDDVTLSCEMSISNGAKVSAAAGKTLTLSGEVFGQFISSGSGSVCFKGSSSDGIVIVGETVFDAITSFPIMFDGGTFVYAGAADATLGAFSVAKETDNGMTLRLASGAGNLTVAGPVDTFGQLHAWFRTAADNEMVFSGEPFIYASSGESGRFRMGGGNFRFASDFKLRTSATSVDPYGFMVGEAGNLDVAPVPAHLTVDDGAKVSVSGIALSPQSHSMPNSDATMTQNGGSVSVTRKAVVFGPDNRAANAAKYEMNGGMFDASAVSFNFRAGDSALAVAGGEMTLGKFANGYWGNNSDGYVDGNLYVGYDELVDVSGGRLAVRDAFSWLSAVDLMRKLVVQVRGDGVLELPATCREWDLRETRPSWTTALRLDGGLLRLGATGLNGSSADALAGLDDFVFGSNGANVEVAESVVVTQPLRSVADAGGIVKSGAGTLTLAAPNNRAFGVEVKEGTLAARFDTSAQKAYPHGLAALWDFDGDEPLKDKTGHGFDLVQMHEATDKLVSFTEGDAENGFAHSGKSAYWPTWGGSLGMTNSAAWYWNAHTVSFWVRMKTFNPSSGLICFMSTRSDATNHQNNNWCICLKGDGDTLHFDGDPDCYKGVCSEDTVSKFTAQEWHMVTTVRNGGNEWDYIDGQLVANEPGKGVVASVAQLKKEGLFLTIGQTYGGFEKGNEYINDGAMMDDIAIFSRALSAEEVAALYAAAPRAAAPSVKVASGATFDMAGGSLATPFLSGAGTVANGTLAVTGRVEMVQSGAAHVSAPEFPASDVVVDFGRDASDPLAVGNYAVMTFDSLSAESAANVAGWKAVGTGRSRRFTTRFSVDTGANAVVAEIVPPGLSIIIR